MRRVHKPFARPACAQDASAPSGPQFFVTPYLWLASIHGTTQTPLPRQPEVNSDISFIDLLSHLDGVPFMGSAEIRDGPFALFGDILHLPASTNITSHDIFFQGGTARMSANTGTALVLYRALDDPSQSADAGIGFRSWGSR
jgi:hypothetical protein